jgi:hypothetical protein
MHMAISWGGRKTHQERPPPMPLQGPVWVTCRGALRHTQTGPAHLATGPPGRPPAQGLAPSPNRRALYPCGVTNCRYRQAPVIRDTGEPNWAQRASCPRSTQPEGGLSGAEGLQIHLLDQSTCRGLHGGAPPAACGADCPPHEFHEHEGMGCTMSKQRHQDYATHLTRQKKCPGILWEGAQARRTGGLNPMPRPLGQVSASPM